MLIALVVKRWEKWLNHYKNCNMLSLQKACLCKEEVSSCYIPYDDVEPAGCFQGALINKKKIK